MRAGDQVLTSHLCIRRSQGTLAERESREADLSVGNHDAQFSLLIVYARRCRNIEVVMSASYSRTEGVLASLSRPVFSALDHCKRVGWQLTR